LTSEKAFVSLTLFNILQFPLAMYPSVISAVIDSIVSLRRIQSFMLAPDLHRPPQAASIPMHLAVQVVDASFAWELPSPDSNKTLAVKSSEKEPLLVNQADDDKSPSDVAVLKNITLQIPRGTLTCVVGAVG
jgi:ABC-type multidrug transport system fused ATPase/permease subunit